MHKALLGYSGGRLPGRSAEEKGGEGEDEDGGEERRVRNVDHLRGDCRRSEEG